MVASKKLIDFVPASHVVLNSLVKNDKGKCRLFDKPPLIIGMRRSSG
jgi:hypothetical protein